MTDETRWKPDKVQVRNAGLHLDEPYAAWGSGIMDVFDQFNYLQYFIMLTSSILICWMSLWVGRGVLPP